MLGDQRSPSKSFSLSRMISTVLLLASNYLFNQCSFHIRRNIRSSLTWREMFLEILRSLLTFLVLL